MTNKNMLLHVDDYRNMPCHDNANAITNGEDFSSLHSTFYFELHSNLRRKQIIPVKR